MQLITFLSRAGFGAAILAFGCLTGVVDAQVQTGDDSQTVVSKPTTEPVFRVSRLANPTSLDSNVAPLSGTPNSRIKANPALVPSTTRDRVAVANVLDVAPRAATSPVTPKVAPHPLDRAMTFANESLASMRANVTDYTARLAKRERIKGVLSKTSFMDIKIRCPRVTAQGQQIPFSIYMKFLQPRDASGREVLWVDGRDNGNLLAHQPGGLIGMRTCLLYTSPSPRDRG